MGPKMIQKGSNIAKNGPKMIKKGSNIAKNGTKGSKRALRRLALTRNANHHPNIFPKA